MVCPGRDPLAGRVEVDDAYWGGPGEGAHGRKRTVKKILIAVAAQEAGRGIGRIRLQRIRDAPAASLQPFVRAAVAHSRTDAVGSGRAKGRGPRLAPCSCRQKFESHRRSRLPLTPTQPWSLVIPTGGIPMKSSATVLSAILVLNFLLVAPAPAPGQSPTKVYRIGWLSGNAPPADGISPEGCPSLGGPYKFWQVWVEAMRERGYVQGQNLVAMCRWTDGRDERAPALAAELVNGKVDLLVAGGRNQVQAAQQATQTIPIVMIGVNDPVGRGLVASLARPGGNITGLAADAGPEFLAKNLQVLKDAIPQASRVAVLRRAIGQVRPRDPGWMRVLEELEAAARALNVTLQSCDIQEPGEIEGAFAAMTKAQAQALLVVPAYLFDVHAQRIVELAAQHRLPAIYDSLPWVEQGGLMAYGLDVLETRRRLAVYVDKILQGAKPADLPVEQPTQFTLAINLKTATALGLTIPGTLLIQAHEVIR